MKRPVQSQPSIGLAMANFLRTAWRGTLDATAAHFCMEDVARDACQLGASRSRGRRRSSVLKAF
ncbi:MAG TPA: hypothetical protein VE779_17910, partial [Candidatus Angelobacter sp.]|nr:hypothetical protein [Candidatus Angelobacter sp.]